MKTTLYLIRHGESLSNVRSTITGISDVPLSELGHRQAACTAAYLKDTHFDAIYASDLSRAFETARPIGESHGMTVIPEPLLRELNCGEWEQKTLEEIAREFPEQFTVWKENVGQIDLPGGESAAQAQERIVRITKAIAEKHPGQVVCIATHAMVLRLLITYLLGKSLDEVKNVPFVSNASVTRVGYENGVFTIEAYGLDKHLGDLVTRLHF